MRGGFDAATMGRIAMATVLVYAAALVVIVIGFALGSQRIVMGSGFLLGGLAALGSLVIRLLSASLRRPAGGSRGSPAGTPISGILLRGVAALAMLWVGVTFFIRSH